MPKKIIQLNLSPVDPVLARDILKGIDGEVVVARCSTEDEVIEVAKDADAIIRAGPGKLFTRRVFDGLEKCRVISCWAGNIDNMDLVAATDNGICVCFAPDASTEEVSDHGLALMLALARKLFFYDEVVRSGKWGDDHDLVIKLGRPFPRLRDLTLGLVGLGRAGLALARKAQGLGMRFVAYDPYVSSDKGHELGLEMTSLDCVLEQSDFVHMYVPLNKETRYIIGADQLKKMKPTAYLINSTARAEIIDETALFRALSEGWIAGAGLDNLEKRPTSENPMLELPNVILSPHVSHISDVSYEDMKRRICDDVVGFFNGQWPALVANSEVKEKLQLSTHGT